MSDPRPTIEEIRDRAAIEELLIRYAAAIDEEDWELLDRVFVPDAEIDYTSSGGTSGRYPEVRAWLEKVLPHFQVKQHLLANTTLHLDGDTARSRTYFFNPMGAPGPDGDVQLFFVGGYYNDELVRTPEGWRIARRVEEQAWFQGEPPANAKA